MGVKNRRIPISRHALASGFVVVPGPELARWLLETVGMLTITYRA